MPDPEFDDCGKSPTGKHSAEWYAYDNCIHCGTGAQSEAPTAFGRYHAEWFDGVEWGMRERTVIAINENQVRAHIDTIRAPEHRIRPRYSWEPETTKDSLVITKEADLSFPFEI